MIIHNNVKTSLENDLKQAKTVWIASAMISESGWSFLQKNIPQTATQSYLIGIDLATDPQVFESLLANLAINARVYETKYTFHPKVYLIQHGDDSLIAFIGSSNTTSWGLEKNVEMNFRVDDQLECKRLLAWYNELYDDGLLITKQFLDEYKTKYKSASKKTKKIQEDIDSLKLKIQPDSFQFFTHNHHEIFNRVYHRSENANLKSIRKDLREKLKNLHNQIYPQFSDYRLNDLHPHHNKREIVSRHFFNQYSGKYIDAMWLHYGKSLDQLSVYQNSDRSINKPYSFINNIRIQIIIQENNVGIWLVLGRNNGSVRDRNFFREQMSAEKFREKFYSKFSDLSDEYWIDSGSGPIKVRDIKNIESLWEETQKEVLDKYFTIGCSLHKLDKRLSRSDLPITVLSELKRLYPLYEMMRHTE